MVCSLRACIEEGILGEAFSTLAVCRFTNMIVSTIKSLRRMYNCPCQAHVNPSPHDVAATCIRLLNTAGHPPPTASIFMLKSTSPFTHRTSILHEPRLIKHVWPREGSVQPEGVRSVGCSLPAAADGVNSLRRSNSTGKRPRHRKMSRLRRPS
jgi:hypothetical protein